MLLAALVVLSLVMAVSANAADRGWYINVAGGVNIPSVEYHADPGFRLGVSGGYNFTKYLGLELETGFLYNHIEVPTDLINEIIDEIGEVIDISEIIGIEDLNIESISVDAKQVPVLLNFMLRWENDSKWEPYAGFGMGGMYISVPTSITIEGMTPPTQEFDLSTFELAYQPKAGIRRLINESMSIGVDYRYLGFGVQSVLFQTTLGNHSIMFEFNKNF
jgi:opacity protein-like surface antigen